MRAAFPGADSCNGIRIRLSQTTSSFWETGEQPGLAWVPKVDAVAMMDVQDSSRALALDRESEGEETKTQTASKSCLWFSVHTHQLVSGFSVCQHFLCAHELV